jgi:hypothetical protein
MERTAIKAGQFVFSPNDIAEIKQLLVKEETIL